jgi:hypothetical protein
MFGAYSSATPNPYLRQLGDCHDMRCLNEWYPLANNITLSKYAFELPEIFNYDRVKSKFPDWQMGLFGHSPDTVRTRHISLIYAELLGQ